MKIDNSKVQTPSTQAAITADQALDLLKAGHDRFLQNTQVVRRYDQQIKGTSKGQYPFAVILSCIDSRVPAEIIFDQGIGDIFNVCVAGNFINTDVLGSIEYACKYAGVKLVVVMGHTSCGAVKGACDSLKDGNLTSMLSKISPAVKETKTEKGEKRDSSNLDFVNRVSLKNVDLAVVNIHTNSKILAGMEKKGEIKIVQAMYDVKSGKVTFKD